MNPSKRDSTSTFNEDRIALRDLARKAAEQFLSPIISEDEEAARYRKELIASLGQLGLTGIPTPTEFGGLGLGYVDYCIALEEIAAVSASYAVGMSVSGLTQVVLSKFGTLDQKQKYIPPLASGQHVGAFSLSESSSGSDAGSLKTTAKKHDQDYVLNGTKLWVTQGNVADTIIVFARTSDDRSRGISAFVIEKNTPGFRSGKIEKKMGLNASPTCELILEDVRVSKAQLIGDEGDGFQIAMAALDSGRITIGSIAVGLARAALQYSTQYSKSRSQFGKPISQFQGMQFLLADMQTQLEAARLMVHHAAERKDSGQEFTIHAAMAKLFATDMAMKVTTDAVQVLGGYGYVREYPVERYMREAKVMQIFEGTNQIQRLVIARLMLGE